MQSRLGSMTEAFANVAVGFTVGFVSNILVLPLFGLAPSIADSFLISMVYTAISLVRSYVNHAARNVADSPIMENGIMYFILCSIIGLSATFLAAWFTHIVWIIGALTSSTWTGGQVALGVIGAFLPPLGIIHGVMIWLGLGF